MNTIVDFIHGFSLGEASARADTFDLAPDLLSRVGNLPPGKAPTLVRVVAELGAEGLAYDFDSGFATGIAVVVDGVEARFGL